MAGLPGEEWIRAELEREEREYPIEEWSSEEFYSEEDDASLANDDDVVDEFTSDEEGAVDPFLPQIPSDSDSNENPDFLLGKDGETVWSTTSFRKRKSRTPARNIITHLPGAKGGARACKTALSFFKLFLSDDLVLMIVLHTNEEISRRQARVPNSERYAGPTDTMEIEALIGLLLHCGATKNSDVKLCELFSHKNGISFFRCVMSRNRLTFLLQNLRFDSKETRNERKRNDKFARFREFWDILIANCGKYYTPSEYVTIDETLLSYRGRCPFKMYIPNKPDKYGLKIVSLCDARTFYFCNGIPYVGKDTLIRDGTLLLPTCYVIQLCENIKNTNRNVTADNWFSSYELAEELTQRKLTYVGTLRKNKREIPPELIAVQGLQPMASRFVYQPDKMLTSFSQRKNKNVILLSTMHDSGIVNPVSRKPDIVEFYNLTKGGVDCFDKMCHSYTTKRCSRVWPMRYFYGTLDIMGINSYVLFTLAGNKWFRRDFLKEVALGLAEPHMKRRRDNPRISKKVRFEIRLILGVEVDQSSAYEPPVKKKRCHMCTRKNDRKTINRCIKCHRPVCKEHEKTIRSCLNCIASLEEDESEED